MSRVMAMGQIDSISEGQRSLGAVSYIGGSSLLGGYGVGCRSRGGDQSAAVH